MNFSKNGRRLNIHFEIYRLLNPPLNTLKASTAIDLLKKGCNHLGFKFQSSRLGIYYRLFIEDNDWKIQPNAGVLGINLSYNFIE